MVSGSVIGRTSVGRNAGRPAGRRFATLTMTFLVVIVVLLSPLSMVNTVSSDVSNQYQVTYHSGTFNQLTEYNYSTANASVTVQYEGVPTAEYNPQFWANSDFTGKVTNGSGSNWNEIKKYGEITTHTPEWWELWDEYQTFQSAGPNKVVVFTGWTTDKDWRTNGYDPSTDAIDPGTDLRSLLDDKKTLDLYATWGYAENIVGVGGDSDEFDQLEVYFEKGNKYTNLVIIYYHNLSYYDDGTHSIGKSGYVGFTLRSNVGESRWIDTSHEEGTTHIRNDLIIDNINLWSDIKTDDAEKNKTKALYANGNQLIIGAGVSTSAVDGNVITIYGGEENGSNVATTDVRIFSGDYQSIYAGSSSGNVGTTMLIILGNTTVSNTVYGGSDNGDVGVTNILFVSGKMTYMGSVKDGYPIGSSHSTIVAGCRSSGSVSDSSNVTISNRAEIVAVQGGGRTANTYTSTTNVTVSGNAVVKFMVCGSVTDGCEITGNGDDNAPVGSTNVIIMDSAVIGSPSLNDSERKYGFGCVFGGGWDTYVNAEKRSTEHTTVKIFGGTIYGSVYGGGFRGTIGYMSGGEDVSGNRSDFDAVDITVYRGTIYGSVYGGGRGGADPIALQSDKTDATGRNSDTGRAYVYGNINIMVQGGIIGGSVYGGGEGTAAGNKSDDVNDSAKVEGNISITTSLGSVVGGIFGGGKGTGSGNVAKVTGSITIEINGTVKTTGGISTSGSFTENVYGGGQNGKVVGNIEATIGGKVNGSVYGGGMNGVVDGTTDVVIAPTGAVGTGTTGGYVYGGGQNADVGDGADVAASVTVSGTVKGSVYGGGENGAVQGGTRVVITGTVEEDVYGGGKQGSVSKSTYVEIDSSTITSDIYGAGLGSQSDSTLAKVGGSAIVVITGNSNITGDVYGGGKYGSVANDTTVTMSAGSTIDGDVYGGGKGFADDTDIASVGGTATIMIGGTVTGHIYGGGNLATVGGTTVTLASATVNGSVYGGGSGKGGSKGSAVVYGSANVEIRNSRVGVSVYGGGFGESVSNDLDAQSIATIDGSTSVTISGSSTITGDVFGGGMYGGVGHDINTQVQSLLESIQVTITGSVTVGGSVYGGGYGETGRVATYVGQRIITINGPSIQGSVYGGSRFGDDNSYIGDNENRVHLLDGESRIYLVSGDVMHGSSGNIYGAGYRGYSNFDTHIYIGTEAKEATGLSPIGDVLSVRSVYGGSSIGDTVTDSGDGISLGSVLMSGDSHIYIGGTTAVYKTLSLSGNVYGSGDYCEIDGDSYITFDNFRQDGTMQSVQKATEVVITSSSLELVGDMDGATTEGSARFAFNRVGMLRLEQTDAGGTSDVVMHAATSRISGYVSSYETEPSAEATPQNVRDHYNSVTMLRGMIFSILGSDNNCMDMGEVSGITYFENDEDYYGAFAIAGKAAQNIGQTDFKVVTSKGTGSEQVLVLESADYHDTEYNFGDRTAEVRAWFIKGAYMVEGTAIIQDMGQGTSGSTISVDIPKIRTTSSVAVVGYYTNSSIPGSLNVVSELKSDITPGNDLVVVLGASGSGSIIFGEGSGANLASNDTWPMKASAGSSGISLGISIATASGFTTTGYIGSITIHMAEMSGDTVTDVFDVVIGVYLRMVTVDPMTITKEVILDGENRGTTEVYLPALSDNRTGVYTVTEFPTGTQYFGINTVPSNISKDGWVDGRWSSKAMESGSDDKVLGTAAVYSPVISINLTMADYTDGDRLEMTINVVDEATDVKEITITVVIILRDDPMLTVTVFDTSLNLNDSGYIDTKAWLTHTPVFRLEVGYNSVLSDLHVLIKSGNVSEDDTVHWEADTQDGFYQAVAGSLYPNSKEGVTLAYTYDHAPTGQDLPSGYTAVPLMDMMEDYFVSKPDTKYTNSSGEMTFDYSAAENIAEWYDNAGGYSEYNFLSEVSNDVSIYSGYTIIVTVVVLEKVDGVYVKNDSLYVDPSEFMMGAPNSSIDLSTVDMILPDGYEVEGWYTDPEGKNRLEPNDSGQIIHSSYTSSSIYVAICKSQYTVTIKVTDEDGNTVTVRDVSAVREDGSSMDVSGKGGVWTASYYEYDDGTISVIMTLPDGNHISSAVGNLENGGQTTVSYTQSNGQWKVSFGAVSDSVTLDITVSDEFTVTFRLPEGADNGHFGLTRQENGDTITIGLAMGDGASEAVVKRGKGFTLDVSEPVLGKEQWSYSNGAVVSVYYDGGSAVYQNGVTIEFDSIDADMVVEIYVSIEWDLVYQADGGYSVGIQHLAPKGETVSVTNGTVHTGDIITLTCDGNHRFDGGFVANGVSVASGSSVRTYTVLGFYDLGNGSAGVMFGEATMMTLEVTLNVHFGILDADSMLYPTSEPEWILKINGSVVEVNGSYDPTTGIGVYTFMLNPDVYSFQAEFVDAYQDASLPDVMVSEANHEFDLYAIPNVQGSGSGVVPETVTIYETPGKTNQQYTIQGTLDLEETVTIQGHEIEIVVTPAGDGTSNLTISEIPKGIVGTYYLESSRLTVVVVVIPQIQGSGAQLVVPS